MDLKPVMKSHWFVGLTRQYASAFLIADHFARAGSRNLEITALGQQGLLIVECKEGVSWDEQKLWFNQFSAHLDRHVFLNDLSEKVIKSYLNLENEKCEKFLLFLQFQFLGDGLQVAQQALAENFKIVELRFIRASSSLTHLILTGTDENQAKVFCAKHEKFSAQLLSEPTDEIKKYFEIFPS